MLNINLQKALPIQQYLNTGLGQIDIGSIFDNAGGDLTTAANDFVDSLNYNFGGGDHPWIPAQNAAENAIAQVVASYVQLKNAGQLTSSYILSAIAKVQTAATGFANFANQYNVQAARNGINDIQNNANAVIANMRTDLSQLPVSGVSSILNGGSNSLLLLGAAIFLIPKFLKR